MLEVLNTKRQEVINALIDRLSAKNKDFENCLNANSILLELSDNQLMFAKLIENHNLQRLINHSCDIRNQN